MLFGVYLFAVESLFAPFVSHLHNSILVIKVDMVVIDLNFIPSQASKFKSFFFIETCLTLLLVVKRLVFVISLLDIFFFEAVA